MWRWRWKETLGRSRDPHIRIKGAPNGLDTPERGGGAGRRKTLPGDSERARDNQAK